MGEADRQLAERSKQNAEELKQKREKLAAYEKAQKEGRRVMTAEERDAAVKSAKDDQQAAEDEAKTHAEEAKAAAADAAKAAAAAARAKQPDLPTADDEKQDVRKQNDEAIAQLKSDIDTDQQAAKLLAETTQTNQTARIQQQSKAPPQNVALLKKHQKEFE